MPVRKHVVDLTSEERQELVELTRKGSQSVRKVRRARILLKADEGWKDREIMAALGTSSTTVERTRKRFVEGGLGKALNEDPRPGQQRIDRILAEHYVESGAKELIKSRIKERLDQGYVLLGHLQVRLDAGRDRYWAEVPALDDNFVRISPSVLREHGEALLSGGAWGTMTIEYDAS